MTVRNSGGTITQQKVFKAYMREYVCGNQDRCFNYGVEQLGNGLEPYVNLDALATNSSGDIFNISNTYNNGYWPPITSTFEIHQNAAIYLDAGDYVEYNIITTESDGFKRNLSNDTPVWVYGFGAGITSKQIYWGCNWSLNGGNVVINTRDGSGKLRVLTCETFLTDGQIRGIIANSQMKVSVSHESNTFIGKINNFNVDHKTNICKFDLKLD